MKLLILRTSFSICLSMITLSGCEEVLKDSETLIGDVVELEEDINKMYHGQ